MQKATGNSRTRLLPEKGYDMKKKTAILGVLAALAMLLGYVESLFPIFLGAPGAKLGLTNLVIVFLLYCYGWKEALAVSLVRIFLLGFLFGNLYSIAFSLAGGMLSFLCMTLAKKIPGLSVIGVSILGGVTHNIGQLAVAAAVVENMKIFYYLPFLLIAGLITGAGIGLFSKELIRRLPDILKEEKL